MRRLLVMTWVLLLPAVALADERFDRANQDFAAGRFEQAAAGYEEILAEGPRAGVLQNLGSARFRQGQYGRAILAFERALLLEPGDPDLRANLKLARDEAAVFPPPGDDGWRGWLAKPSRRHWAVVAVAAALYLPIAATGWLFLRKRRRWAGPAAVTTSVAAVALSGLSMFALDLGKVEEARGIVIADPATLRLSPFPTAEEQGSLTNGREVTLGRRENGYFRVGADGGALAGWLAAAEVQPIIPESTAP